MMSALPASLRPNRSHGGPHMGKSRFFTATCSLDGTAWTDPDTAPLVGYIEPPGAGVRHTDGNGLVHIQGWTASRIKGRHKIEIQSRGRRIFAPDMSPRPDVMDHLTSTYPGRFDDGEAWNLSVFLHLPEGEKEKEFRLVLSDGAYVCTLGKYRVRRPDGESDDSSALSRVKYKEVWNGVSSNQSSAMIAVAGYDDEAQYEIAAQATLQTLRSTVGVSQDDIILEIGAGVGRMGQVLAPLCRKWIATDVSENMLSFARQRNSHLTNIDYVPLSGWDLEPIPTSSVDVVYCTVVFMHLDEWERYNYIREAHRILKPGGRIYVDNFNLLSEPGWKLFQSIMEHHHPLDRPPNVSRSSTPRELATFLTRAGFSDVNTNWDDTAMFCHAWAKKDGGVR